MKKVILASTSTLYNGSFLDYLLPTLSEHFIGCKTLLFVPYARPNGISYDDYTQKVSQVFAKINITVNGIHEHQNPTEAIQKAEAIFTGGGNTFLLVSQLYKNNLMTVLKNTIEAGTPYLGTSAGSNIGGMTMNTTNDMPIVLPESFQTLGLIPFNLNPHFLDANSQSTHMGETRETRINEFHTISNIPVLGLREGSWLEIYKDNFILKGTLSAKLFRQNEIAVELETNTNLSFLT
ncbi:(alpha)-aspartyl dipeptidase [Flavobacterium psychrophilum]|uniref:Dipeptidase E n=2 Tax=Flavobacterium psychrophilum TaxID=96345 RepID=A6H1G8_FLAPJ|nr:dipeptidase PepE [Flavobacterium psychrophilum]AIG30875.1 (alpha)-aspartyl dipeptidase [Flavobacterium psychrophilum]AIG33148.1 (alpha)-aspartyl dipeptidase [Flavobacterium psychrophilum]AIG35305.1 (alpha)-aspartyl dipeptidase [Flavobacterium psychrophilum]AIG37668.1 (alpha)-aspartyl dipeptidase [Flavobacterium psychrophilum]AIG39933.1 (alpha)-aspartyl dipeptidase [Flavobacterium psychrophilum]